MMSTMRIASEKRETEKPNLKIKYTYVPLTEDLKGHNKKYYDETPEEWEGWQAEWGGECGVGKSKQLAFDNLMVKVTARFKKENI